MPDPIQVRPKQDPKGGTDEQPAVETKDLGRLILRDPRTASLSSVERAFMQSTLDVALPPRSKYSVYTISEESKEIVVRAHNPDPAEQRFITINPATSMGRPWTEREMLGRLKDFAESPFAEKLLDPEARKRILAQTDPDKAFFSDPSIVRAVTALERFDELHSLFTDRVQVVFSDPKSNVGEIQWCPTTRKGNNAEPDLYGGLAHLLNAGSITPDMLRGYLRDAGLARDADKITARAIAAACDDVLIPFERNFDPKFDRFERTSLRERLVEKPGSDELRQALIERMTSRDFQFGSPEQGGVDTYRFKPTRAGVALELVTASGRTGRWDAGLKTDADLSQALLARSTLSTADFNRLFPSADVSQTNVGNCYLVSFMRGLAELPAPAPGAPTPLEVIARTSIEKAPHGYYVSVPLGSSSASRIYVSEDNLGSLSRAFGERRGNAQSVDGADGFKLLELAYMMHETGGRFDYRALTGGNSWQAALRLVQAAHPQPLALKADDPTSADWLLDESKKKCFVLCAATPQAWPGGAEELQIPGRKDVPPLLSRHEYTILGVNGDQVTMLNPHRGSKPFVLSRAELTRYFDSVDGAQIYFPNFFSDAR